MNSQLIRNVGLALLAASSMFAQESKKMVTAEIPFAFHAGGAMLRAGEYTVAGNSSGVLELRSKDAKSTAMVITHNIRPATLETQGKLIFNRYGNEYFLSQVWTPGVGGLGLPKTKLEKEQEASARRNTEYIMARK